MTKTYYTEAEAVELAILHGVGDSHGYMAKNCAPAITTLCNTAAAKIAEPLEAEILSITNHALEIVTERDDLKAKLEAAQAELAKQYRLGSNKALAALKGQTP